MNGLLLGVELDGWEHAGCEPADNTVHSAGGVDSVGANRGAAVANRGSLGGRIGAHRAHFRNGAAILRGSVTYYVTFLGRCASAGARALRPREVGPTALDAAP